MTGGGTHIVSFSSLEGHRIWRGEPGEDNKGSTYSRLFRVFKTSWEKVFSGSNFGNSEWQRKTRKQTWRCLGVQKHWLNGLWNVE